MLAQEVSLQLQKYNFNLPAHSSHAENYGVEVVTYLVGKKNMKRGSRDGHPVWHSQKLSLLGIESRRAAKPELLQSYFRCFFSSSPACLRDDRTAGTWLMALRRPKSWIIPLYRTLVTCTPAASSLRPYASPSSRSTSFSAVWISVGGKPFNCSTLAWSGEAIISLRFATSVV